VGDSEALGKALALVKQANVSGHVSNTLVLDPDAHAFFKESCIQIDAPALELLLWIRTHWALLHVFLERILKPRNGVDQFVLLANTR
jgi:hypothetical protein